MDAEDCTTHVVSFDGEAAPVQERLPAGYEANVVGETVTLFLITNQCGALSLGEAHAPPGTSATIVYVLVAPPEDRRGEGLNAFLLEAFSDWPPLVESLQARHVHAAPGALKVVASDALVLTAEALEYRFEATTPPVGQLDESIRITLHAGDAGQTRMGFLNDAADADSLSRVGTATARGGMLGASLPPRGVGLFTFSPAAALRMQDLDPA